MRVAHATEDRLADWAAMRHQLWPWDTAANHAVMAKADYLSGSQDHQALLAFDDNASAIGFAEAALRRDYVEGCATSPVVFLEGIYVVPEHRKRGVARLLSIAVAEWGRTFGCHEFASNALIDNTASHAFHAALGFAETERVVFFRKEL